MAAARASRFPLRASPLQGCDFDGFQQGGESSRKVQLRAAGETTRFHLESAWNLATHDFPVVQDYLSSLLQEKHRRQAIAFGMVICPAGREQIPELIISPQGEGQDVIDLKGFAQWRFNSSRRAGHHHTCTRAFTRAGSPDVTQEAGEYSGS